jgi:GT2 family glycosyltransferase
MNASGSMPSTGLIIPVHNGGSEFIKCLDSVSMLNPSPDQTIIVDDGSSDGSGELAQKAGFEVVRTGRTGGPGRARNLGAARTEVDILIFLDADVSAPTDYVGTAVRLLTEQADLAAVLGSYDDSPGHDGFFSQYRNLLHHFTHQSASERAGTFWTACGAIWRGVFLKAGGFDESLRYLEDVDLGMRLVKQGRKIHLGKQWQVKHWKSYSALDLIHTDLIQRALPWTRLALQGNGFINDLNTKKTNRYSVLLSLLMPLLAAIGFFQAWAWLAALACLTAFSWLNRDFYIFLHNKRGAGFLIKTIPWHIMHYLSGAAGLGLGCAEHLLRLNKPQNRYGE